MSLSPAHRRCSDATTPNAASAPLACSECRRRHVKCDGQQPLCARCLASGIDCAYVASRRGQKVLGGVRTAKRIRGNGIASKPNYGRADASEQWSGISALQRGVTEGLQQRNPRPRAVPVIDPAASHAVHYNAPLVAAAIATSRPGVDEHLIDLYYAHFHPVHPLLPPKADQAWPQWPRCLQLVVQLVGSHYCRSSSASSLRRDTEASLTGNLARGHCEVQALLLYSIVLQARGEHASALSSLSHAVCLAVDLKMDRASYACEHAPQSLSFAETLRRTWWELVIIDTMMAAYCRRARSIGDFSASDVLLPLEESRILEHNTNTLQRQTFAEFEARLFAIDEPPCPSSAYRIEAARILSDVVQIVQTPDTDPDSVQSVDNCLAAWSHHLPPGKLQIISASGEVDHLLFQAHLLIHCGVILLHLPRSHLVSQCPVSVGDLGCAQHDLNKIPTSSAHVHAVNALAASKALSDMAALRVSPQQHSPFFICALMLAATVQLAAVSAHKTKCIEQHRRRISLILGLLKSFGQYFDVATRACKQLKPLAAALLNPQGALGEEINAHTGQDGPADMRTLTVDDSWLNGFFGSSTAGGVMFDLMPTDEYLYGQS